jgi:hypothetical protein
LEEVPPSSGTFVSKGLILVSNDVDDVYQPNTDEQLDDVTHKVKLGDDVTFTIPLPVGGDAVLTVQVPVKGQLQLDVWRFDATETIGSST